MTSRQAASRILAFGRGRIRGEPRCANIANAVGVGQYVRIADEVAGLVGRSPRRRVLDWGAGWGQLSLLLRAHGLDVVAYDIEDKGAAANLLAGTDVPYVVAPGPGLPFANGEFDAVLNCGVLEHVGDERAALAELRRVLRPGGWLITYNLPNRHGFTEWLGRAFGRWHHERTYTRAEAIAVFVDAGFDVLGCRPFHVLPRNIWSRGRGLAILAAGGRAPYEALDAALVKLPGLAHVATGWAVLARRRP